MPTNTWRRSFGLLLSLGLLLGIFCMPASASGSRHPYFNDRGTLTWYHSLSQAQHAARRSNKVIFIEYGRKKCSNCKKLAQNVLPHSSLRGRMGRAAVGLAAECDRPERAVYQMFRDHLPGARKLPFAAFITPDGQWITGWYGARSVSQVSAHLSVAESHVRAMRMPAAPSRTVRRPAAPVRSAPVIRSAPTPAPTAARRVYPAPPPPSERRHAAKATDCNDDSGDGGECVGGDCKPPSFELPCLPNPFDLLAKGCKPKSCPPTNCPPCPPKPVCPPGTVAKVNGYGPFPPPKARVEEPVKLLAKGVGSPDGAPADAKADKVPTEWPSKTPVPAAAAAAGVTAVKPMLPAPVVRKVPITGGLPPIGALGSPDGPARKSTDRVPSAKAKPDVEDRAKEAAARGDWAAVLALTRGATEDQRYLRALNREAHAWAHSRLAYAVSAVRKGRLAEAHSAVAEVKTAMSGEAEAVDAERGDEAIELMRDIDFLAEKSPLRTSVRKTAYEKMRGTRWAPLFSECPQPSAALSSR